MVSCSAVSTVVSAAVALSVGVKSSAGYSPHEIMAVVVMLRASRQVRSRIRDFGCIIFTAITSQSMSISIGLECRNGALRDRVSVRWFYSTAIRQEKQVFLRNLIVFAVNVLSLQQERTVLTMTARNSSLLFCLYDSVFAMTTLHSAQ